MGNLFSDVIKLIFYILLMGKGGMIANPSVSATAALWLCILLLCGCVSSFSSHPPCSLTTRRTHCAASAPRLHHQSSKVSSARGDENAMIENNDNKNSKASENENIQVSPSSPRVLLLADDPAVSDQIMKARKLLDDARKKQAREQEVIITPSSSTPTTAIPSTAANTSRLPFFVMVDDGSRASTTSINSKKIKSTTSSGSIIADGETMTQISSTEQWSRRKLSEMFSKESHLDYAGKSIDDQTIDKVGTVLADRDVVASIWNLRKTLQNEDFARVFDKRNRFIGDLD